MVPTAQWDNRPARIGLILAAVAFAAPADSRADGWHNAALATRSLDQWLDQNFSDLKSALPNLKQELEAGEVRAGRDYQALQERAKASSAATAPKSQTGPRKAGTLAGKLNPQQQALMGRKAADCLEILACMNERNIIPREFPDFQLQQIPRYREAAKSLLKIMGPPGGQAVTLQLRSALMGMNPALGLDVSQDPRFYADLLDVLKEHIANGNVSIQDLEDLEKAAAGTKSDPALKNLAQEVQKALAGIDDLDTILTWAEEATDAKRRVQLYGKARGKFKDATISQLLRVLSAKTDGVTKDVALRELDNRWSSAGPLELLQALEKIEDARVRQNISAALAKKSPRYAEVKRDLPEIWKLAGSSNPTVASAAREQMVNAFLRAPMGECLDWLAQGDAELNKLIWEQLDDRISRADAERKAGYREAALATLSDKVQSNDRRIAAIDLLARLKDRQAAGQVIEMLLLLPQDLRPRAGKLLRDLTGQNFGPFPGDGTAEVGVAVTKWRDWWKKNGGK